MFKLIFNNIRFHSRRSLWIIIELILFSAAAWFALEPVVVTQYIIRRNPGYDIDRLVNIQLAMKPTEEKYTKEERYDDLTRLLTRVRSFPEVEYATIAPSMSLEGRSLSVSSIPVDSVNAVYADVEFIPGTDFFRTFGIRTSGGADGGKVFNEPVCNKNDIIVSRSVAELTHPGVNALGHYLNERCEIMTHGRDKRIIGIVDDVTYRSIFVRTPIVYKAMTEKDIIKRMGSVTSCTLVARLKQGINPDDFIRKHSGTINTELSSGNIYAHSPNTYTDLRDNNAIGYINSNILCQALLVFLIVNLCLGVIGTFYLQTRNRSRDAGIMRAFGATRGSICRNLIAEGWCIAILAWIIGNIGTWFIAGIYGMTEHEYMADKKSQALNNIIPLWIDDFATHFWVISAIVLVLLLVTVTIGVYIPARRIAGISPVDALRENN